jgi:hypothetical protein
MKESILLCLILTFSLGASAQKGRDIIYLKNGSVIKGAIIDTTNGGIKIKTKDKSVFVYSANEIDKRIGKAERKDSIDSHRKLYVGFDVCPLMGILNFSKHTDKWGNSWQNNPDGGLACGFSFAYHRKYVGFETGISYRTFGSSGTNFYAAYGSQAAETENSNIRFHNVEIPFLFNVYSKPKKVRFIGSFGLIGDMTILYLRKDNLFGNESKLLFKGTGPGGIVLRENQYWDLMEELQMGVETSVTKNAILRVCPTVCFSIFEGLMEGIDIKLLFKVKGR